MIGINITKTEGKHGTDEVIAHFGGDFGVCMGFILKAPWRKNCIFYRRYSLDKKF